MYNLGMIDISKVVESTSFTDSRKSLDMDRRFNFDQFNLCRYRHSSYNAVLLYRGIPSDAVFSKPIANNKPG